MGRPGDRDYRAYVGDPANYDLIAAATFNLLTTLGLREHHRLLDIGCGSLRNARLLIPYLGVGGYCGIEPNAWLVDEGRRRETGSELLELKRAQISFRADCRDLAPEATFDFILLQSIFSHTGTDLLRGWLEELVPHLAGGGMLVATAVLGDRDSGEKGWLYPGLVRYRRETLEGVAGSFGLRVKWLDWPHPIQKWFLSARSDDPLAPVEETGLSFQEAFGRLFKRPGRGAQPGLAPTWQCVCVLGMHRSGTSCLTGIMQRLGVELGEVFTENPFNKRGNREHPRVMRLNDALLEHNGGAWDRPVLVEDWTDGQADERDAIIAELRSRARGYWGFKDPRTLFTLPFWRRVATPRFIGTFRHPIRVAASLEHRNGMPRGQALHLWLAYNRRLLELARLYRFPLVDFDLAPGAYLDDVVTKLVGIGLDASRADEAAGFFLDELRHQDVVGDGDLPEEVAAVYRELCDYHVSA